MTDKVNPNQLIIIALAALSVIGYIVFLQLENKKLRSELSKSELENDKAKNEKDVHALSDVDLNHELDADLGADPRKN